MYQNLWYSEYISWRWLSNGMDLDLTTNRPTHLTLYWTTTPPIKKEFWRIQRGITTRCGWTYKLINTIPFEQIEPGLQHTKSFAVAPWPVCFRAWWYIKGDTSQGSSASTSIIYDDHFPGLPGPPIPGAPELITTDVARIHNGNHYSFWSSPNWYAVLPFRDQLRVYKRIDSAWVRQDQANEPAFPPGQFTALDARISSDYLTFHIAAYLRASVYPPDTIMYYTYDIASDAWALAEAIDQNTTGYQTYGHCSLSLDSNDIPHVVYTGPLAAAHRIWYANRLAGSWSVPASFLSRAYATWRGTSAAHSINDTFHASAQAASGWDLKYNSRPPGGPIGTEELVDGDAINLFGPGLSTFENNPNIAYTDYDFSLAFALGPAPWAFDLAIYPPFSRFPSIITPPTVVLRRYIFFLKTMMLPQAVWWKAGAWTAWDIADPNAYSQLAATYLLPSVFSYVAARAAIPTGTRFWALVPPL